jgi:hypothetical protein
MTPGSCHDRLVSGVCELVTRHDTMLIVSQEIECVRGSPDRVAFMAAGRMQEISFPAESFGWPEGMGTQDIPAGSCTDLAGAPRAREDWSQHMVASGKREPPFRACQAVVEAKLQLKPTKRLVLSSWRVSATA